MLQTVLMPADLSLPELGPIHHCAYLVERIEDTVAGLSERFRAGPFFVLDGAMLQNVTSGGEAAEFGHRSALGCLAGEPIELMETGRLSPARVADRFAGPRPRLHHLSWAVPVGSVVHV